MTFGKSTAFATLKALIVEDEFLLADDVARLVRRHAGTVAGPCASVLAAQAVLATEKVDLAILDINLGDHDVLELADALECRSIPFLFLTGYSTTVLPDRFRHVPLIRKPCEDGELVDVITQLTVRGGRCPPHPGAALH